MTDPTPIGRVERFDSVGSTNDVVREWLAEGEPEICVARADEQTAGRGRDGRSWVAPTGSSLLLSLGFRPTALEPEHVWRLSAVVSLAMIDAAEEVAGLREGTIHLKWPNDLFTAELHGRARKLGGVLGETAGVGTDDPIAVVGIGINANWPAHAFPPELADSMTSLRDLAGGRPIDRDALFDAFLARLEPRYVALMDGRFDRGGWAARQITTGRWVRVHVTGRPDEDRRAVGVDTHSGALLVEDEGAPGGERAIHVGEIGHLRIPDGV